MLRPNCFLSFITLNPTPKDWNTWICWKHPWGATDSNTSSPQWQWYCTCLNCYISHGRSWEECIFEATCFYLTRPNRASTTFAIVRSGGVSETPSGAPKRLPLQTVWRRRCRPRFWWVKYYNEGKWPLNPIENLWRKVKNKVRIGEIGISYALLNHFWSLLSVAMVLKLFLADVLCRLKPSARQQKRCIM